MSPGTKFEPSSAVVSRDVGDETMLVDLVSGTYFGLNAVGGRLWQELESGRSVGEACDRLLEEFDVARPVLERDVSALLDQLLDRGLIRAA